MNVRITYPAEFVAGVYWNNKVLFNTYQVRCKMITATSDAVEQNIALERLKYMLFHQMQNSVFVNAQEKAVIKKLESAGLTAIALPLEPVDQIVGMMLFAKLNAVMEGRLEILELDACSDLGENITYSQGVNESTGPFAEKGWWSNPEPTCTDSRNTSKVVNFSEVSGWQALELHWSQDDEEPQGNVVVAFKKDD